MHRRSLPIASPCHEDFDGMQPMGTRRFCEQCQTPVHDLSAMTRAEASHFLAQRGGQQVCVRYRTHADGSLRFRPAPPPSTGPVLVALAGLMAACTGPIETAAELEIPDAPTCEDIDGYTIPCVDVDESHEPEEETESVVVVETVEPGGELGGLGETVMGQMVIEPVGVADVPPAPEIEPTVAEEEGCPLQRWDEVGDYEPIMGRIEVGATSRRESRRIEREYRREQRRERRRAGR